jgi:hypothetical protein
MINPALKLTIPVDNTSSSRFQMGGRRRKTKRRRGGVKVTTKVDSKIDGQPPDEVGLDYSVLDKIPVAKDKEDEAVSLARIAEEGRGGPEVYASMIQEEGRAGIPSFEMKIGGKKRRVSRKRRKQRRRKSKKARR